MHRRSFITFSLSAIALCWVSVAQAQRIPFKAPEDIELREATIMSEGSRLHAELFSLKSNAGKKLPTIIMSHGWGGVAAFLRADAVAFARAGYLVVAFDYRGWGASEGRVILTEAAAADRKENTFTANVQEIREVVDPLDQANDLLNVIAWVQGEPQSDTSRIGLWGSSYSGGHVIQAAARDKRVKALVSQVGGMDSRFVVLNDQERALTEKEATQRARGEIGYPKPGAVVIGNLRGAPIREKLQFYAPVEEAKNAEQCAMLIIVAEKEELFDNKDHGLKAYEQAKGPKKLVTIPGITHYGIYREAKDEAQRQAIEWFDEHLKK